MSQIDPCLAVLTGDDTITRRRTRDALFTALAAAHPGLAEEHFDSSREDLSAFLERVITPSLFQTYRVFFLTHAQEYSADELSAVKGIAAYATPDACLIVEGDACRAAAGKSDLPKAFSAFLAEMDKTAGASGGSIVFKECPRPREWEIARWLVSQAPSLMNRRITQVDAEYLVDLVGSDFDRIHSELQKIDVFLPDGKPVDRATITEVVESTRQVNAYELAQTLGRKDLAKALSLLDGLFTGQFYAPLCVSALFGHFWSLFRVRVFARMQPQVVADFVRAVKSRDTDTQNKTGVAIGRAAGIIKGNQVNRVYPMIVKAGLVDQARAFTEAQLRLIISWLRDYDVGIKTGTVADSKTSFQLLCYRIARVAQSGEGV